MSHNHDLNPEDIRIQLYTLSDTRDIDEDKSGQLMKKFVENSSYDLAGYEIIRENYETLKKSFNRAVEAEDIDVIISSGGTGITRRDRTVEVVREILEVEIPGFGELFRHLSYKEIGTRSILSQALAARTGEKIIICLPGSPGAVKLAFNKILLNELPHMVEMARS